MSLYEQIGQQLIHQAISKLYDKIFIDPIIGYFFAKTDKNKITQHQIEFTTALLGGPKNYQGGNLAAIHHPLKIRPAHFGRRQVLLKETLEELGIENKLANEWLKKEESLRAFIVRGDTCNH